MPKKTENSDFNWGDEGIDRGEKLIHVLSWVVVFLVVAFAGLYLRRDSNEVKPEPVQNIPAKPPVVKSKPDVAEGKWTVLVGRFVSREKAEAFAADYSLKGMRTELISENSGYYVQVERFVDEDSALTLSQTMLLAGFPARVSNYRLDGDLYEAPDKEHAALSAEAARKRAEAKAEAKRAAADKRAAEERRIADAKKAAEKAAAEKVAAARAAAEKAEAEKAAAEKRIQQAEKAAQGDSPSGTLTAIAPGSGKESTGITKLLRSITRDTRSGEWTIQAGVFSHEENVRSLKESLENNLFKAFVLPTSRGHKVQVGDCDTREEAEKMLIRLKTIPEFNALEPYVIKIE